MTTRLAVPILLLALAIPAWAEDAPTATKKTPLVAQTMKLPSEVFAVAPSHEPASLLVSMMDGSLARVHATKGVTWKASLGKDAAVQLVAASRGDVVLAGTLFELIAVSTKDGSVLWRTKRPVAFDVSADGTQVVTIDKKGAIATLATTTGKVTATTKAADRREVAMASVHAVSGLAVLGVADG